MLGRRSRRPAIAVLLVMAAAIAVALVSGRVGPSSSSASLGADPDKAPALSRHLAKLHLGATFAPPGSSGYLEGDQSQADDEFLQRALPGTDIAAPVLQQSASDWSNVNSRGDEGSGRWRPLGPTHAKGLPNPFRDRSVYTAGTPDASGRIAAVAIDPNCGSRGDNGRGNDNGNGNGKGKGKGKGNDDREARKDDNGQCRLWIANANGGVWRTDDALSSDPHWRYLSRVFEHNNTASIQLDPNDPTGNTLWVGTGEPNACGSGCEAGVGLYKSTNGGNSWTGPFGKDAFYDRAAGSIAIKPGDSNTIFVASGRGIRGLNRSCCGGADAIIPGAPHFGLWRSTDGGQHWELVNQGANVLCTASSPDAVALNQTACSARGARRVIIDPVNPNVVYASFFSRGIWRSQHNGDPGTWEQIMAPLAPPTITTERPEFDVVKDPATGETRMYVGVGGGGTCNAAGDCTVPARFRKNLAVRNTPAAAVAASWVDMTDVTPGADTPAASSSAYCDPQCSYDNYVFAPAAHFPNSGATADTVYLSGSNRYRENNWGPASVHCCPDNPATGRSNGRAVLLSTDAGATFTDLTEDKTDPVYPDGLHPDHHMLTVNPTNWKQFFDVGDGGIQRSNGNFVSQSDYCGDPNVKGYTGTHLTFCQLVLSRTVERFTSLNSGLRTLHFYELANSPFDPNTIIAGAQDNGSWEIGDTQGSGTNGPTPPPNSLGEPSPTCSTDNGRHDDDDDGGDDHPTNKNQVWVQINIADGMQNNFDVGDRCFRQSAWQNGQLMVAYTPKNQLDMNWISDTLFQVYGTEATQFSAPAIGDPTHSHWLWTSREHVFRSINQGRNEAMTKAQHREFCNVWYGTFSDFNNNGVYDSGDFCDDWKPLGDPGPAGRLTIGPNDACPNPTPPPTFIPCPPPYPFGTDRSGGSVSYIARAQSDPGTLWASTSAGRIFVSKNADTAVPTAVVFDRIDNDPTATNAPPRYPTAIFVDPKDSNHAWITYSGFNAKSPGFVGHVFEVHYVPGASTFRMLDGNQPRDALGDIPATSIAVSDRGTIYVGTDYGVVASKGDGVWRQAGGGLPNLVAADLHYVAQNRTLYLASHGQGAWSLSVKSIEDGD